MCLQGLLRVDELDCSNLRGLRCLYRDKGSVRSISEFGDCVRRWSGNPSHLGSDARLLVYKLFDHAHKVIVRQPEEGGL